jgi:hypothetical protein
MLPPLGRRLLRKEARRHRRRAIPGLIERSVGAVDLSDRAEQILARKKSEQAAGSKLNALLQSIKDPDGS